jgi:hypothetical protein
LVTVVPVAARDGITLEERQAWMRERHSGPTAAIPPALIFTERHYTVAEIAVLWNLSQDAVRRIFESEPGVLVIGGERSSQTRRYRTLRIPESVLQRVHRRLANV